MNISLATSYAQLEQEGLAARLEPFVLSHPDGNYFQSPAFFQFIEASPEFAPVQLLASGEDGAVLGSLLGVIQTNGSSLKQWFSKRLIVWGGPLTAPGPAGEAAAAALLRQLKKYARGRAIYVESRNLFDLSPLQAIFEEAGFSFRPHLNYLVPTDDAQAVKKRMSSSRLRQIKSSLKLGAQIDEAASEADVLAFYGILQQLYREKVKKPLPSLALFLNFWKQAAGKFFVIRYEGEVVGGIVCPIFGGRVIYEWYVCGKDSQVKGLHPSVLATWAPIEHGLEHGYAHFDFMGAGKPDDDYGVREFKARFGGEEVAYGRYHLVLNKPLYEAGKLGLSLYQKMT